MYIVNQINIKKPDSWLYDYCSKHTALAWRLYNAALFRIRQRFTGFTKKNLTENEKTVLEEILLLQKSNRAIKVKQVFCYTHLERLMRVTENPDFFAGLPMQTAQAAVRQAVQDFENWLASLKAYQKDPSSFTGKPRMPRYKKAPCTVTLTNQDAVVYKEGLKLPLTERDKRVPVGNLPQNGVLKEVKLIPSYGRFILSLTFECPDYVPEQRSSGGQTAAVDFGTDNIAAIVTTDGSSRIYKGGAVLSENRLFAKKRARAVGILTKGHEHMHASSRHLDSLSYHHANFVRDQLHKISRSIIEYCLEHQVDTLILGENRQWKQRTGMGDANNQKFVQMPIAKLRNKIMYKAALCGITVILQEESYTSKASFIDGDFIPVYGKEEGQFSFSGKRIRRGLYVTGAGIQVNADLNAAANIMKKAVPNAWDKCACLWKNEYHFLTCPEVLGFHELNPKGIPVKRIAAV